MWTLYAGAGLALTAGLLLGVAMKPQLVTDGAPAAPRPPAGWTGASASGALDEAARVARYGRQPPGYVMGTDWQASTRAADTAPMALAAPPPIAPAVDYYDSPLREEPPAPPAEASEPAAGDKEERVSFPSIDGGTAQDAAAAAPDDEAAPEANGGASLGR